MATYMERDSFNPVAIVILPDGKEHVLDLRLGYTAFHEAVCETLDLLYGEESSSYDEDDIEVERYEGFGPAIDLSSERHGYAHIYTMRDLLQHMQQAEEDYYGGEVFLVLVNDCINSPHSSVNSWDLCNQPDGMFKRCLEMVDDFVGVFPTWEAFARDQAEQELELDTEDGTNIGVVLGAMDFDKYLDEKDLYSKFFTPHLADGNRGDGDWFFRVNW